MKRIILLILLILSMFYAIAQNNIIISGIVKDAKTNETLPGASIYLQSNKQTGTATDYEGNFSLEIPYNKEPDYLIVSYIGYKEFVMEINATKNISFEIKLMQDATMLNETVIKGRRIIAQEFTIKQIKKMEVYLNPASKADALLAVGAMPSSTTLDESANISLRGSSPAETGIFLNGVPIYDAVRFSQLNGIGTFSIFNTDIIQNILVFPGNPPLEFGNTTAGLVSLQTEENMPDQNITSLSVSLANIGGSITKKTGKNSHLIVFGNYQPSQVIKYFNSSALDDLKDFYTTDLGTHFYTKFNDKISLKVLNYFNAEGYEYAYRTPSFDGVYKQNKIRNFTVMSFVKQFENAEITSNNGLSFSKANFAYGNMDINLNNFDGYFSINYQQFFNNLSVKTGVSVDTRKNNMDGTFPENPYAQSTLHPFITFDTIQKVIVPESYIYLKYNLGKKWVLGGGIRKNIPNNDQQSFLSKQGNINYEINKRNSINLSIGNYHRYNLPREKSDLLFFKSNQLSLDYKYKRGITELSAALFAKKSHFEETQNTTLGTEIFTKFKILRSLECQLSYTALDSKNKTNNIEYNSEYDLDYFSRGILKYEYETMVISAIFMHRHGNYYQPVISSTYNTEFDIFVPDYAELNESVRLPDYSKLDISWSKLFLLGQTTRFITFFNMSNVFNTLNVREINYNNDYSEMFNEYFSKRTIYFGFIVMF